MGTSIIMDTGVYVSCVNISVYMYYKENRQSLLLIKEKPCITGVILAACEQLEHCDCCKVLFRVIYHD